MNKRETRMTKDLCDRLRLCGAKVVVIAGDSVYQPSGLPDRYLSHRRWHGWVEFKSHTGSLNTQQRDHIREFSARRPFSAVVLRLPADESDEYVVEDHEGARLFSFTRPIDLFVNLQNLTNF